jgi:anthranilate synthase component 1
MYAPEFPIFKNLYESRKSFLLSLRLVADLETPVSAMLKVANSLPYSFLLESVEGGENLGRYSFIGLAPDLIWRCRRGTAEINRTADLDPCGPFIAETEKPLNSLRALLRESRIDFSDEALPPMAAGLFGYLGYDMVREMEKIPDTKPDTLSVPDAILSRPTILIIFDNVAHKMILVTPVRQKEAGAEEAYRNAIARLEAVKEKLVGAIPSVEAAGTPETTVAISNTTREQYHHMVERVKEYIRAGDIFQAVPSHRFAMPYLRSPLTFYRALRRLNPSPFLFLLNFDDFAVAGSSPEILVRLRRGEVTIRPIAGTRKRGANPEEDQALAEDLLADEKERAEHLMLLDLGRNDVGRVAEIGSVAVTERMVIERYSHVMHLVSNVTGKLRAGLDEIDALAAGFPAGTVSGAPKVRAMEIIDEVETARRGIYGGCIGYFGADGDMDTCIALRTAVLKDGQIYIQAGGGVVADSDPEAEYQETCNKARALIVAAQSDPA